MKKILLFITVIFSVYGSSCKKENVKEQGPLMTAEGLVNSDSFKYDQLVVDYIDKWFEVKTVGKDFAEVDLALADGSLNDSEVNLISQTLGFTDVSQYKSYLEEIYSMQNQIEEKYQLKAMSSSEVEALYNEAVGHFLLTAASGGSTCAESFAFCAANVTAAAMGGHVACAALDLMLVPGILYHASVLALQAVGNQECSNSYQDCLQAQSGSYYNSQSGYWELASDSDFANLFY